MFTVTICHIAMLSHSYADYKTSLHLCVCATMCAHSQSLVFWSRNMAILQYNPYSWTNCQNSCILLETRVEEHNGDFRFQTGSINMAVFRTCIMKNLHYNSHLWTDYLNSRVLQKIGPKVFRLDKEIKPFHEQTIKRKFKDKHGTLSPVV